MAKKKRQIPPELKAQWAENQRRLAERIAELERRIAARETGDGPPQA